MTTNKEWKSETHETRVQRGIIFLDTNAPGWRVKINLETLDASSPIQCVIGQISGRNYRHYLEEEWLSDNEAVKLGFTIYAEKAGTSRGMSQEEIDSLWQQANQKTTEEHAALTDAWKEAISALR